MNDRVCRPFIMYQLVGYGYRYSEAVDLGAETDMKLIILGLLVLPKRHAYDSEGLQEGVDPM